MIKGIAGSRGLRYATVIALVAVMAAGPLLRWRRDDMNALLGRMIVPIGVTAPRPVTTTLLIRRA